MYTCPPHEAGTLTHKLYVPHRKHAAEHLNSIDTAKKSSTLSAVARRKHPDRNFVNRNAPRLVHTQQQFAFPQTEREWRGMAQSAEPVTTMWEVQVPEGIAPGQAFQASVGGLLMVRHSSLFFAA